MIYARNQLKGFEVYEYFEALINEFHMSQRTSDVLIEGVVKNPNQLKAYCKDLRMKMTEETGVSFRHKPSRSLFTKPAFRMLGHDAVQIYTQCNSENKDLDRDITAEELLFMCRRLRKMKKGQNINADRVYLALTMYREGELVINKCGHCKNTFAAVAEQNTMSNCTVCFTSRSLKSGVGQHSSDVKQAS